MSLDADDEILQDFLVEAGEILERLNEELVQLEQRPDDLDMLNSVFRSFHTIKGGAGFLAIDPLVNVCHRAEDVFNVLRQGERGVDSDLMDAVLQVLDVVNGMFADIQAGNMPASADPVLLQTLEALAVPGGAAPATPAAAPPAVAQPAAESADAAEAEFEQMLAAGAEPVPAKAGSDDITEEEFEALLEELHGPAGVPKAVVAGNAAPSSDEISEDEFDALLDELHGPGKGPGAATAAPAPPVAATASGAANDSITEEEFDALLDQLHGAGKAPAATAAAEPAAAPSPTPAAPAPRAAAAPSQAPAPQVETSVRVDTKRLDDIMNLVGELVLARNRLATLKATMADEDMAKAVANLDVVTADLQNAVMKTRMQPIKKVFGRFPRVVRDLARSLKKEINLEMVGEETDLDKNLVEALADPLVHLVRNAVDHGIESPEERMAAGKPRAGTVVLAAEQEGDHILLSIEDDGKGMDPAVLRAKAVEKGLMDAEAAARLDDKDAFNLIFAPGFSTKTEISDVSGRGVGMDVVKTRIGQLNGTVEIDSQKGRGSRLSIRVPLTLAIMPTLMVVLGKQPFALPLGSVSEIFNLDINRTNVVDGQLVVMVREKALPLFYLRKWLVRDHKSPEPEGPGHVVVVHVGNTKVGFVVEQLIGQEEVVIKPLGALLQGLAGFAGATITGDGRIALILDVPSLMKAHARRM
ncbi:MAG: chemotaxis protein CheA [Gammaproteobacteria bacterium]|nr:chemotaxis protein CheA [Gammaproteobacteria bacterium]